MAVNDNELIRSVENLTIDLNTIKKNAAIACTQAQEKLKAEIIKLFDFNKKFIKTVDPIDNTISYLWCDSIDVFFGGDYKSKPVISLSGYGFSFLITNYRDMSWASWDEMIERSYDISLGYSNILNMITEITEEEFNSAFHNMQLKVAKRHAINMTYIKNKQGLI